MISFVSSFQMEMSDDDTNMEEYPTEIHDYLISFEKSLGSVDEMLKTMMSVPRSELLQKVNNLALEGSSVINTRILGKQNRN